MVSGHHHDRFIRKCLTCPSNTAKPVIDVTRQNQVIAEVDFPSALTTLHEKAIYLHDARQFQVEKFDYVGRKAYVRAVECDYFTDAINGEEGASRTDYTPTEDDNVTVQGVSGSEGGLGYFGFTYYEENADKLTAVQVDSGAGCVAPSVETAQDGTYTPLSRPLFIYPSKAALAQPQVKAFFDYYVANDSTIAADALFIPLNEEQKAKLQSDYAALTGS